MIRLKRHVETQTEDGASYGLFLIEEFAIDSSGKERRVGVDTWMTSEGRYVSPTSDPGHYRVERTGVMLHERL